MVWQGRRPVPQLSGDDLCAITRAFAVALERNVEVINALNVFPVPDGDTGTNMLLTLRAVLQETQKRAGEPVGAVLAAIARGALLGARGNSGVILSQFFAGLARGLEKAEVMEAGDLPRALREAQAAAYKAVGNPVEGTILTVIREVADGAEQAAQRDSADVLAVWEAASLAAAESVVQTPSLLPVLREAGVVDAGGQGLALMLEAGLRHLRGEDVQALRLTAVVPSALPTVREEFLTATESELYGYCIQFMIQGEDLDVDATRERMAAMAASAVVVGDSTLIKVHVHALDPGPPLSCGSSLGSLSQVRVDNIDEQHQEFLAAHRGAAAGGEAAAPTAQLPVALVAVALGQGLKEVLRDVGAGVVVEGGQTMNPSTQEILEAVEQAPSEVTILLPNNRNVTLAAQQAAQLSSKKVHVVPSLSIPQGVAALLAFNPDQDLEWNLASMNAALATVRTGEVCRAVRSTVAQGLPVQEGQTIGLLDGELVAVGEGLTGVVMDLLRRAVAPQSELVTLYWGRETSAEEAQAIARRVPEEIPGVEVEVVYGGQPYYPYIISVE